MDYKIDRKSSVITRIMLGAAAIGILVSLILGFTSYFIVKSFTYEDLQKNTVTNAQIAALSIDTDVFESITAESGYDKNYDDVKAALTSFLSDETIAYIYTLRMPDNNSIEFVVDADPDEPGEIGEVYEVADEVTEAYKKGESISLDEPYTDEWGTFYSGYAPIINAEGKTVGIVAVDCSTDTVKKQLNELVTIILIASFFCIVLALAGGFVLSRRFKPLVKIAEDASMVSQGKLNVSFDYYNSVDEIGIVCRTIEKNNRAVSGYISDISRRLEAISKGNFNAASEVEYVGDYASIKTSMDSISASLSSVFRNIENVSSAVYSGSEGVAAGATQLSASSVKQTELIDNIISGMNELSDRIKNNVASADSAKLTAHETENSVKHSNDRMRSLLDAMNEISDSSQKIRNIISTIEDIAFQTNILALNASVEAARAGASGKGFAVVADEVRNLAHKSAEASERTAKLIEQSVEAVESGMSIAKETSDALSIVVNQTAEIDKLIVEINAESHNQLSNVDIINDKLNSISGYVNSSAANAEESAAASEELNGQVLSLNNLLAHFSE